MAKKNKETHGAALFDAYFSEKLGSRWPKLREALLAKHPLATLDDGLTQPYYLDHASVLVAQALGVQPGDDVLDMCAAPGGKSLVLALALQGQGLLHVNERSSERFFRLRRTLATLIEQPSITYSQHDARQFAIKNQDSQYDKILLDAPCSSEAHVLNDAAHLAVWSTQRSKRLANDQMSMICQAIELGKPDARLVYSTCSINTQENDDIIRRLIEKRPHRIAIEPLQYTQGEATTYGWQFWPDVCTMGPLYMCKIRILG